MIRLQGDAAVTAVLISVLLAGLITRDELPAPPTPTPPPFVFDVSGASIGGEANDAGMFWTVDAATATITIVNTMTTPADTTVSMRLADGPCGAGNMVAFFGEQIDLVVEIRPGETAEVTLSMVEVPALGQTVVDLQTSGPPCPPVGSDPRSIYFQIFTLGAIG